LAAEVLVGGSREHRTHFAFPEMGAVCCTEREADPQLWRKVLLAKKCGETEDFKVAFCSIRGYLTHTKHSVKAGDVIIQESPIALVFAHRVPTWLAAARQEIEKESPGCAWQFCLAAQCLSEADIPLLPPPGLWPLDAELDEQVLELCADGLAHEKEPSEPAFIVARHIVEATPGLRAIEAESASSERRLAKKLDAVAAGVAKHGFRVLDDATRPVKKADALFYHAAFVNLCSGGRHSLAWEFDDARETLVARAVRDLEVGEELTFDFASKLWPGGRAPSGHCACAACCHDGRRAPCAPKSVAQTEEATYTSGSTEEATESSLGGATEGEEQHVCLEHGEPDAAADDRQQETQEATITEAGASSREQHQEGEVEEAGTADLESGHAEDADAEAAAPHSVLDGLLHSWGAGDIDEEKTGAEGEQEETKDGGIVPSSEALAAEQAAQEAEKLAAGRHLKLEHLVLKWGGEYIEEQPAVCSSMLSEGAPMSMACRSTAATMTDAVSQGEDAPLMRLLKRCEGERLPVTREVAERALSEEAGHVGKALMGLRRAFPRRS